MRGNPGRRPRVSTALPAGLVSQTPALAAALAAISVCILWVAHAEPSALAPEQEGNAPALQEDETKVSPHRLEDVPALRTDVNAFPSMDNFAWRAFIALNWPSLTTSTHRGVPDLEKSLGDPGPRVWETYKSRTELFQIGPDGAPIPSPPWATYDGVNPCGANFDNWTKTLATFEPFMDFNQPVFAPGVAGNPLVAQNGTYTRYEVRLNEPHYLALALTGWSQNKNLPDVENPARIPAGSIVVKAAWKPLTNADTPANRARYYVVKDADIVEPSATVEAGRVVCGKADVALVGLHIVVRTKDRPQGLWSTFEHVDNVPPIGKGDSAEPDAKDAGAPYSYFDASKPDLGIWPEFGAPGTIAVSMDNPPKARPQPMQVVRRYPIHPSTMMMNRRYWAMAGIKGTVWENYMLTANQWPTFTQPIDPRNDGVFFPERRKENLVSTVMETYFQDPPSSCMACHDAVSNKLGRDFVGLIGSFR